MAETTCPECGEKLGVCNADSLGAGPEEALFCALRRGDRAIAQVARLTAEREACVCVFSAAHRGVAVANIAATEAHAAELAKLGAELREGREACVKLEREIARLTAERDDAVAHWRAAEANYANSGTYDTPPCWSQGCQDCGAWSPLDAAYHCPTHTTREAGR